MSNDTSKSPKETDALISWLVDRLYTLPDDWTAIAATLVFFGAGDWSSSAYAYGRDGQPTPLPASEDDQLFLEHPDSLHKWLASATHSNPDGTVPARAVLVQIINRGGGKIDPRIQVSEDLEEWALVRYPADVLAQVIRPQTRSMSQEIKASVSFGELLVLLLIYGTRFKKVCRS